MWLYDGEPDVGDGGSEDEPPADGGCTLVCRWRDGGMWREPDEEVAGMRRKLLAEAE